MFAITFTHSALDDIGWFRKRERTIIFDVIEKPLTYEPNVETRNKKKLRPNRSAEWELRSGKYRVFYDVSIEASTVEVKMVGYKDGNRLLIQGVEYML